MCLCQQSREKYFFCLDGKDDLLFLLEEAAALKIVSRKEILRTLIGEEGATNEDVFVSLLADLHQEQNSDKLHWFGQVSPVNRLNETFFGSPKTLAFHYHFLRHSLIVAM